MTTVIRPATMLFLLCTLITGVAYPLLITGIAQLAFPVQANGSFIDRNGTPVAAGAPASGSRLVGQQFASPRYFWSRPSATAPAYNAAASSGSNLGPLNPALIETMRNRAAALGQPAAPGAIPVDLLTASGSGLDPHISPAAALYQVPRVAAARKIDPRQAEALVRRCIEGRTLGVLGEPRVNVLLLNLALDKLAPGPPDA